MLSRPRGLVLARLKLAASVGGEQMCRCSTASTSLDARAIACTLCCICVCCISVCAEETPSTTTPKGNISRESEESTAACSIETTSPPWQKCMHAAADQLLLTSHHGAAHCTQPKVSIAVVHCETQRSRVQCPSRHASTAEPCSRLRVLILFTLVSTSGQ
eukprot:scaffold132643_cov51-Phaeocystis_antarctica.AAC.2